MSNIDPKLEEFIMSQLKKGRDVDLIRSRLQNAGWDNQEIEDALIILISKAPKQEPKGVAKDNPGPKQEPKNEPPEAQIDKDGKRKKIKITSEDVIVIREDGKSHMAVEKYEVTEVSEKIIPEAKKSERMEHFNQEILNKANIEIEKNLFLFNIFKLSMNQRLRVTRAFFVVTLLALLIFNAIEIFMFQWFEYGAR
jgi:hypothetical protein